MRPGEFFIGVRDFFAVIVPGAVALYLLPPALTKVTVANLTTSQLVAAAVAAYLIGSVASGIGSLLDWVIDPVLRSNWFRKMRLGRKLEQRETIADQWRSRLLVGTVHPGYAEEGRKALKSFWWDCLRISCEPAIAELNRIEAASKLFRSLVSIFVVYGIIHFLYQGVVNAIGAGWAGFAVAAIVAAVFYAVGRAHFLSAVYRLGAAYALSEAISCKAAGEPKPAGLPLSSGRPPASSTV